MALRRRPHRRHRGGEEHATVEDVGDDRDDQHERRGDEQPVEDEPEEWQLEHVEADVGAELGVGTAERPAVAEQQPLLPLRRGRQGDDERHRQRAAVAHEPQTLPEHLVEALDDRVDVGGEALRREAIGDQQVDAGEDGERDEEEHEQCGLGADHTPEDVVAAEAVVPQVVDVEPGDSPSEDDDDEDEDAERDEDGSARDPPPSGPSPREVGGTPHGREATPRSPRGGSGSPGALAGARALSETHHRR